MITRIFKPSESNSFFIFGPRGSGKSTLLKSHFSNKNVHWVNLLHQATELELSQHPDHLLEKWKANKTEWIVIDEIQKIPRLLDVVHHGIEEHKIKFALTGSSARKLKRGSANLLAGRAFEYKLFPFSAIELGNQFNLERALQFGLLPKLWNEQLGADDATDFLASYVNTYLKEEIAAEQLVRNLDPFRRFLVSAAQSNGKIINHAAIERDCGVSNKQSERHFDILVDTLIGSYLHPYNKSIRKRQTQKAKFYFCDNGIVRALQRLTEYEVKGSSFEYGDLFETFLINEFIKLESALKKRWEFSYFQSNKSTEIDLIIDKPKGKPVLVEIKSFNKFIEDKVINYSILKNDIDHEVAYLLSNDPIEREYKGIRCLHWKNGLKEIFEL